MAERENQCNSGAWLKYLTLASLIIGSLAAVIGMNTDELLAVLNSQWVPKGFLGFLLFFGVLYNLLTIVLGTICYREKPILPDDQLPSCTVIVPAYNEGEAVTIALKSILASNYPAGKLEIIAIDDGSRDDTWKWIAEAAAASNGRIRGVKLEQNRGKRHAIQYGAKLSKMDVIITVDSDSVVEADSIRYLTSPFVDPTVGAVAGSVQVSNLSDGVLPRMMDAHYAFSCCILRAANSVMRTVVCTPGALSAYRRSALMEFLGGSDVLRASRRNRRRPRADDVHAAPQVACPVSAACGRAYGNAVEISGDLPDDASLGAWKHPGNAFHL